MNSYQKYLIYTDQPAREALRSLEDLLETDSKTLFIINELQVLTGTITDGDIRRGLLNGLEISSPVSYFMNKNFKYIGASDNYLSKLKQLRSLDIELVPIIDQEGRITNIINLNATLSAIPAVALIMAGGRGERLKPFTNTVPKPMLKVGEKPIIEHNIDRLIRYGIKHIFISVKYLSEQIREYFGNGESKGIRIDYVEETEPLGTIGALTLINSLEHEDLLVLNSDILTNIDFEDFYDFYIDCNVEMCIASIPYHVQVPYAVLETDGHVIKEFSEKPSYTYYSNAGIYFMKAGLKREIPVNKFYNVTDLMEQLIGAGRKICHYPILGYWLDIGKHQDYAKAQEDVKHIQL